MRIADILRPEARDAVLALHEMGLRTALLTGDARQVAESIAKQAGIDVVHAEILPDQKSEVIKALLHDGRKIAMVGDGINSRAGGSSIRYANNNFHSPILK